MDLGRCQAPSRIRALFLVLVALCLAPGCGSGGSGESVQRAADHPRTPANTLPVVSLSLGAERGAAPFTTTLAAAGTDLDGEVVQYVWSFGDGQSAVGAEVEHTFREPGLYRVTCEAFDDCGGRAFGATTVVVGDLRIRHANRYPTRLARGPHGRFYVSDATADAVFIYDEELALVGEIAGPERPLGVAVDAVGRVYVGSDGMDEVQVYDDIGRLVGTVGSGRLTMPNDLALDEQGRLFVCDSRAGTVRVYDAEGVWLHDIGRLGDGDEDLRFPSAVAVGPLDGDEPHLFVADQGHARVQVYTLDGEFVFGFGERAEAFSPDWEGRFAQLQSLAVAGPGRRHGVASYMNVVQLYDPDEGRYLGHYGGYGRQPGELNLPLDILVTPGGRVLVTNAENHRLEEVHHAP